MTGTQLGIGSVLGAATTVGGGAAILPLTGSSPIMYILPLVSIACGVFIIASLAINRIFSKEN